MRPSEIAYIQGKGCIPDVPDERDYQYEQMFGAIPLPEQYNIFDEIGGVKVEHQGGSSSCVGQAWSKYAEVLNYFDEKQKKDLSAKFIYSRIFQPQGGASIRDGANTVVDVGACREEIDPSYENGNPPSEQYIRQVNLSPEAYNDAIRYKSKAYATIATRDIEAIKQAIYQNKGVVSGFIGDNIGWNAFDGVVRPPTTSNTWGHAVYLCGWKKIDGKDYIIILNSWSANWGDKGFGYIHPDYWSNVGWSFNLWTLLDNPNNKPMEYVIVGADQYLVYEPLKIALSIGDEQELVKLQLRGLTGSPEVKASIEGYLIYPGTETLRLKDILNL